MRERERERKRGGIIKETETYSGFFLVLIAHKSGLTLNPWTIRPKVPGKLPPPWAKAIFKFG